MDRSRSREQQARERNYDVADDLPIWQVACATLAAPRYFPPITIQTTNKPRTFKDGGFGSNNPSEEAYHDIIRSQGRAKAGPFISIGTGGSAEKPLKPFYEPREKPRLRDRLTTKHAKDIKATVTGAVNSVSQTVKADENMYRAAKPDGKDGKDGKERFPYYRFNGGKDLAETGLAKWKGHSVSLIPDFSDDLQADGPTRICRPISGTSFDIADTFLEEPLMKLVWSLTRV